MLSLFESSQFKKEKEIYNYIIRHANENMSNKMKQLVNELEMAMREVDKGHVELSTQRTLPVRNDETRLQIVNIRKKLDKLIVEYKRKNPNMDIK